MSLMLRNTTFASATMALPKESFNILIGLDTMDPIIFAGTSKRIDESSYLVSEVTSLLDCCTTPVVKTLGLLLELRLLFAGSPTTSAGIIRTTNIALNREALR